MIRSLPLIGQSPRVDDQDVVTCFDADGHVVATKDLPCPSPWIVLLSKTFEGRFFFFNLETRESKWSLQAQLFEKKRVATSSINSDKEDDDIKSRFPKMTRSNSDLETSSITQTQSLNLNKSESKFNSSIFKLPTPKSAWSSPSPQSTMDTMKLEQEADEYSASMDELSYPAIHVMEGLGRGGYSTVLKVKNLKDFENHKTYAMKVIPKNISDTKEKRDNHKAQLLNELQIMTEIIPSPFLQQCRYAFESITSIFFVIDLNSGGDLFYHLVKRIEDGRSFSEKEYQIMLAEIYLALEHLHKHNIVHRDIKIENIMLTSEGHIKLVDFGLSCFITQDISPMKAIGSLIYMAPELIKDRIGGRFTDWWAYGVLAHELLTGKTPWSSLTDMKIISKEILYKTLLKPTVMSEDGYQFVKSLLDKDFNKRLGTIRDNEIRSCSFFKNINWNKTLQLQCSPAFIPNAINVNKQDQDEALNHYHSILQNNTSQELKAEEVNDHHWMLGLDTYSKYLN